ncbi:hypothetical protein HZH68_000071 [Vespula germanica]|uniref:Uncharacterized protein n=1 Tax=Vespula germanica TaxID=30212 RepID=A0A834NT37_VESGE|nr:hypothetical protein HZH68_000071 [Vespula germanica]
MTTGPRGTQGPVADLADPCCFCAGARRVGALGPGSKLRNMPTRRALAPGPFATAPPTLSRETRYYGSFSPHGSTHEYLKEQMREQVTESRFLVREREWKRGRKGGTRLRSTIGLASVVD